MDCRHVDRLLEANLDGRLSGFERVALRQHVRMCDDCRAKVEAMTAFAETVEATLACADDGPDWRRLAPPVMPVAATPPLEPAPAPRAYPSTAPARRRRQRPYRAVTLAGLALVALALPLLGLRSTPRPFPVTSALAVEATRHAAGTRPDLLTGDVARARAWLDARGLPDLPPIVLSNDLALEGVYLTYYDAARVAGFVLTTPRGRLYVHLRPGEGVVDDVAQEGRQNGLEAVVRTLGGWHMAVIGPSGSASLSTVAGALAGDFADAGV